LQREAMLQEAKESQEGQVDKKDWLDKTHHPV
jgi:hypothetical protein